MEGLPGRPAPRRARPRAARRCSTSPARRRTTSPLRQRALHAEPHAERIRPLPRRHRREGRRRDRGRRSTRRSACPASIRRCARTAARSPPPKRARCRRSSRFADLRGDLHMHTTESDGKDDIETMARARAGQRPVATSRSPTTRSRWRWPTASTKRARWPTRRASARVNARLDGITLLAGIECDIRADGTMDLDDDDAGAARYRDCVGALRRSTRAPRR